MAYADDSVCFLKDLASVKKLPDLFSYYSKYSDLKLNFFRCEIAGIGSLKEIEVAVFGIKCVNLKVNNMQILRIHFSHSNKLNIEKNYLTVISNIQNVLKIWCMRNLTLEAKKRVFKMLALSKIVHLCLIAVVSKQIIEEIESIQKNILWNQSTWNIKHNALCNSFATGGLRNVDTNTKIAILECSWI